jgi:hypothetical protein
LNEAKVIGCIVPRKEILNSIVVQTVFGISDITWLVIKRGIQPAIILFGVKENVISGIQVRITTVMDVKWDLSFSSENLNIRRLEGAYRNSGRANRSVI